MINEIRRVGFALTFAFIAIFVQLNYVQIFAAEEIASKPANIRSLIREYSIRRGDILTADGVVLATSNATKERLKYLRVYPEGELYGHITGFYSIVYGATRVESTFNDALLGESGRVSIQDIEDEFLGSGEQGDDVVLTINSQLQEAARAALGDERGAIVALDPRSGEVRALWSNPSYDPGPLAFHDLKAVRAYWRSLNPKSRTTPLLSLATSQTYPPGSTFKVATAAAALTSRRYTADSTFPDPQSLPPCEGSRSRGEPCLPLTNESLTNFTQTSCTGGGRISLFEALRISCDTTFALIGLDEPEAVFDMSQSLGFNEPIPFDVGTEPSTYPRFDDSEAPLRAYAAIGQQNTRATALQMAVVAASVANGGEVPRLRLVDEILDPSAGVVQDFGSESLGTAMPPAVARTVKEMMVAVVASGTGTAAQLPGVEVAGKTGTAQTGIEGENPHTWFIAFAPADNPKIAVAVIVENGGSFGSEATGGAVAAPIARAVMEADRRIRQW